MRSKITMMEENNAPAKVVKHFRMHIDTGDIYAIEQLPDIGMVGCCGPLAEDELKSLNSYEYSHRKNRWVRRNKDRLILWFPDRKCKKLMDC
jgi:hypothetical protein